MAKSTQVDRIVSWLAENPNKRFTARQIAQAIIKRYPDDYSDKRQNERFIKDGNFIQQVVREIGAQKERIAKKNKRIRWQDKPGPRVYWMDDVQTTGPVASIVNDDLKDIDQILAAQMKCRSENILESDLYPLLIQYLSIEQKLFCMRIDEKRSSNRYGVNANKWLHPDIVAMQPIAKDWHELVQTCVLKGDGQSVRLWSFEVKKILTRSNVREYYFQAVSNSSWASEGYLVCMGIANDGTQEELRMLSALHGIGIIVLNITDLAESEMLIPAHRRTETDWQTVNRLVIENADMKDFIDLVLSYYQTGRLRAKDWNR